ncbi:UvrD-helicase domain-containing protein [Paenalcaligenes hominis]|uniref:UvrD-helicase domain-containing protein n=1 Tax=Paenalcaligenes hominis TaxID=643674 RepID=UPI003524A687
MSLTKPSDYLIREAAVDATRSFLVQAPAGSGKTELLTDRILALLALVQKPEEIVAITFTRAAAAEMHARVIEKLQAAQQPEPEEAYKKQSWHLARAALAHDAAQGWNLLEHPARLSIRTIDSLCAHLVRAMPVLSGLGGVPEVSDQADSLYLQAARHTIARADQEPDVAQVIKHLGVNLVDVEALLVNMLAIRDQWLPTLSHTGSINQLQTYLEDLVVEQLERLDQALPLGWQEELSVCAVYAHQNLLAEGKKGFPALADWSMADPLLPIPEHLTRWQGLIDFLLTAATPRVPRKRRGITKSCGFPAGLNVSLNERMKDWVDAYDDTAPWLEPLLAIQHLQAEYSTAKTQLLEQLTRTLLLAVAELRLAFIEHGQVDFIEIAQRALDALGYEQQPSELLLRLDRSISHLLVDEFQDTSLNQIKLLERLTSGWAADDGRTVFLVGDPMQSIYRFRKAEVGLFLQVQREQRLGDVELTAVALSNNFRSAANLVHWVNELGADLFPAQPDLELGAVTYNPSVPFHDEKELSKVQEHPFIYQRHQEGVMSREQALEAAQQRVVSLCQAALTQFKDSAKPAAVLVRARSHLGPLIQVLQQAGIPTKAVEIDSLHSRPVVQDIVQLVRALKHPGDRLAWLSLLRAPLCGLRLASLHQLCGHHRTATIPHLIEAADPQQWDVNEWERLQHVANVLLDQSQQSGALPFAACVEHCWLRLGGEQIYGSPNEKADAENVFRLLEQLAPYGDLDLDVFEEKIQRLFAVAQNATQAVEVMTIHKSKGLEFESVILYDLNRDAARDKEPLLGIEQSHGRLYVGMVKASDALQRDPLSVFIAEREKKRAEFEMQRLLYVAVTRARHQLHLVGVIEQNVTKDELVVRSRSLLHLLWPRVEAAFTAAEPQAAPASMRPQGATPQHHLVRVQDLAALPYVRPRHVPTGSNHWQWNEEPFKEAAIGTVAHAWLERIGREGRAAWDVERIEASTAVMRRQLLRAGFALNEVDEAVMVIHDTLLRTLTSTKGQWLLDVAKAYREWTLIDAEGRVSIIDLAISQEDQWLIVDFKTGQPYPGQSTEEFLDIMKERYAAQLRRYCDQVTAFDGRQAKAALYFPRADLWCEI